MLRTAALAALATLSLAAHGQQSSTPTQARVAFEVASIKSGVPAGVPYGIRPVTPAGQFRAVITVQDLIGVAYGAPLKLLSAQVVGGPGWVNNERFEITAKAEGLLNSPGSVQELLFAMMRTLLADRFQLQLRRESRQLPIFNLGVDRRDGKLGPRLRPEDRQCASFSAASAATADPSRQCGFTRYAAGAISARGMSLDDFASGISNRPEIQRVIRNRTGLTGKFDLDLEFTASEPSPNDASAPAARSESGVDLFTALKEQLGLKLEGATGPVDVFVIDRVERPTLD